MKSLAFITLSLLAVVNTLVGCASSTKPGQPPSNQTNIGQTNNMTVQPSKLSSSNNTGVTGFSQAGSLQFANSISQAMVKVKQGAKMPFLFAPTEPTFQPNAPFVGVQEYASDWDYSVSLFSMSTPVLLNDPRLGKLPASEQIGMFGGTFYSSHEKAMTDFNSQFYVKKAQYTGAADGFMKQYLTGASMNYGLQQDVIEWREGKWTIDVFGVPSLDLINMSERVDSFLRSHALPPTAGHIFVNPYPTGGAVTEIGWVFGNTFYVCESPSMMDALKMAVSMREYDSYKVTP